MFGVRNRVCIAPKRLRLEWCCSTATGGCSIDCPSSHESKIGPVCESLIKSSRLVTEEPKFWPRVAAVVVSEASQNNPDFKHFLVPSTNHVNKKTSNSSTHANPVYVDSFQLLLPCPTPHPRCQMSKSSFPLIFLILVSVSPLFLSFFLSFFSSSSLSVVSQS